jgi:uncharacterized membrane protein (UPF0127 family)
MRRRRLLRLVQACLAAAVFAMTAVGAQRLAPQLFASASAQAAAASSQAGLQSLVIVTASGRHPFRVELARTEAQREQGLMFRRSMPADRGMLFDFKTPQSVMMWMKNTYIPLDMVFMGRDGRVTHIAANAEPLSETIIPSDGPAFAVLELNGGVAQQIGLKNGDRIENALFQH